MGPSRDGHMCPVIRPGIHAHHGTWTLWCQDPEWTLAMQMWPVDPSGGCTEAGQPEFHVLEGGAGVETDVPTSRVWIIANRVGIAIGVEVFQKHLISVDDVVFLKPDRLWTEAGPGGVQGVPVSIGVRRDGDVIQAIVVEVTDQRSVAWSTEVGVPQLPLEAWIHVESHVPGTAIGGGPDDVREAITIGITRQEVELRILA